MFMDSSQPDSSKSLYSAARNDDETPSVMSIPNSDLSTPSAVAPPNASHVMQLQSSALTQESMYDLSASSHQIGQPALLLPTSSSPLTTPLPIATTSHTHFSRLEGDTMIASRAALQSHNLYFAPQNRSEQIVDALSTYSNSPAFPPGDRTFNADSQIWKTPSTASSASSSLGLFLSTDHGNLARHVSQRSYATTQMQQMPIQEAMSQPRSLNNIPSLPRQLSNFMQSTWPSSISEWQVPHVASPPSPVVLSAGPRPQQQMLTYKQPMIGAHTSGLTTLLGLHPNPLSSGQFNTAASSVSSNFSQQPDILHPPSLPGSFDSTQPRILPRDLTDIIMIVDQDDSIVCTSNSMQACAGMLSDAINGTSDMGGRVGWDLNTSNHLQTRASDLFANEQAINFWQQACLEIRSKRHQQHLLSQQQQLGRPMDIKRFVHCRKELVLRQRSQQSDDDFIELIVIAAQEPQDTQNDFLMVQVRPFSIPTVASVSSHSPLGSIDAHLRAIPSSSTLSDTSRNTAAENAELRLLVSRYGLILRTTYPAKASTSLSCRDASARNEEERTLHALLGEGATSPAFGKSLVDVPKLAPLLHVVAQAAVVGLAQTVKLNVSSRQITATVQPVLRGHPQEFRNMNLPAAKVWISLSAPSRHKRRSSSALTTGLYSRGAGSSSLAGLTQSTAQRQSVAQYRRHSGQTSTQDGLFQVPGWHPSQKSKANAHTPFPWLHAQVVPSHAASTSSLQINTGRLSHDSPHHSQTSESDGLTPVKDSLGLLMAELEEENRGLRRQIEAHRRKRHLDKG